MSMYTQTPRSFQIGMISKSTVYIYTYTRRNSPSLRSSSQKKPTKTNQNNSNFQKKPERPKANDGNTTPTPNSINSIKVIYPKGPIFSLSIFAAMWVKGSFKPRISTNGTDGSRMGLDGLDLAKWKNISPT